MPGHSSGGGAFCFHLIHADHGGNRQPHAPVHLNAHRGFGFVIDNAFVHHTARYQFTASFSTDACGRPVALWPRPVNAAAPLAHVAEAVQNRPHVSQREGDAARGFHGEGHRLTSGRCAIKVRVLSLSFAGGQMAPAMVGFGAHIADLVVSMITAPILYGSPLDAGRRSSRRPTQPSVGTVAGTRMDAPRSETP